MDKNSNSSAQAICRDCEVLATAQTNRCKNCGSPRLLKHQEIWNLAIAHIDCDAFYAAVEKRDNPELFDKPVIIGGGKRGVVSTCCYVARIRGVRSAMPMFKALQACPDAIVIKPDMKKYAKVGNEIRQLMGELTPAIEPLSIDEAFLDLSGTQRLHGAPPAVMLVRMANRIRHEVGITVSVGLSYCKFLAKVASDLDKPSGFYIIGKEEAASFLRKQPVSIVWGVGKQTQKMLSNDGITHLSTIQDMEEGELMKRYGSMGKHLFQLSHGRDFRRVKRAEGTKSISSETTFNEDISSYNTLRTILRKQSERVADNLKRKGLCGHTIVLKLKSADFKIKTRNKKIEDPTQLADRIFNVSCQMLKKESDGTNYRLLGVGVSNLKSDEFTDPEDLVDIEASKRAKIERAVDGLKEKFGGKTVELGLTFKPPKQKE